MYRAVESLEMGLKSLCGYLQSLPLTPGPSPARGEGSKVTGTLNCDEIGVKAGQYSLAAIRSIR